MRQIELKNLIRDAADKPIRVCAADGASYRVSQPDFAFTTADALILASEPGHGLGAEFAVVPLGHITRVEVLRKKARAA